MRKEVPCVKQTWLADDASGEGKHNDLSKWFHALIDFGKKHGYYVNEDKCWLIVKSEELEARAKQVFGNSPVNITTEGKRHLGAVLGSKEYKDIYCQEKVTTWKSELETIARIAETEPQSAYAAYTKAYRSKFTFFVRTIEDFEEYLAPIDSLLFETFIPALFAKTEPLDLPTNLISLNPKDGGLGIQKISDLAQQQFKASCTKTKIHVETIIGQNHIMKEKSSDDQVQSEIDQSNDKDKREKRKKKIEEMEAQLNKNLKPYV